MTRRGARRCAADVEEAVHEGGNERASERATLADLMARTRRGGTTLLLGAAAGRALDLAATVLFARSLGLEGYGALVAARALGGVVNVLCTARSFELLLAYLPRFEREGLAPQARDLYALVLRIEGLLGLGGLAVACALGWWLPPLAPGSGEHGWLLLPLVFCRHWGNNGILANQAVFRLRERYGTSALQAALAPLCRVAGLAVALALGQGLLGMALVDGAAELLSWLAGAIAVRVRERRPLWLASWRPYRVHAGSLWRFSRSNWAAASARALAGHGAEVTLLAFAGSQAVGAFGLARRLAGTVSFLVDPLVQAVTPELFRLAAAGRRRVLRRYLVRVTGLALLLLAPLAAALIGLRGPLVRLAGGGEFAAAGAPLVWLVLAFGAHHAVAWLRPLLLAFRRPGAVLLAQAAMGIALVGTCALAAPILQARGAALAVVVGHAVQIATMGSVARRLLHEGRSVRSLR